MSTAEIVSDISNSKGGNESTKKHERADDLLRASLDVISKSDSTDANYTCSNIVTCRHSWITVSKDFEKANHCLETTKHMIEAILSIVSTAIFIGRDHYLKLGESDKCSQPDKPKVGPQ
jgi:hypothetical protein